ncbi:FabD/lysophospholipase-like protein [Aspergillus neoniger CBS 115656]|uniref:FabD/lysophospholipase-like protein n=1 Tax=Aspergillus neoniger (strain CBS 115656) TaxID=1448310 RepID=A0A318Z5T2_ASPNB|nr:FabD/lysophospholipase-like protein [Aspergillus neoniger CBS 115656]PYH35548.1 FabD/lysophospholipase-like protein [Aspergillus neoniger CBS 115656]
MHIKRLESRIFWKLPSLSVMPNGVIIGAVKPNFGHSEGASGITSLIKAILSLERSTIPPNIHLDTLNPQILDFNLTVPLEPMEPADRRQRVSINEFGIGGANAHVILYSAAEFCGNIQKSRFSESVDGAKLLVVSAQDSKSLESRIEQVCDYANKFPGQLCNIPFTLGVRRQHLSHRAFCVTSSKIPLRSSMFQKSCTQVSPQLSFVFTGQGSQWADMGKGLLETYPCFQGDMLRLESALKGLEDPPSWSLRQELCRTSDSRVTEAEFCQPLCTAIQIGLVNFLASWGVRPAAVVGHSSGEIAAAYAAGAISEKSAIILAYYPGKLAKQQMGLEEMANIGLSSEEVTPYLEDGVLIACRNNPQIVTLFETLGSRSHITHVSHQYIATKGTGIYMASEQMKFLRPFYEASLVGHLQMNSHMSPMLSSVTTAMVTDPQELGAAYWRRNLESPVLFSDAVSNLLKEDKAHLLLDIGPHSALSGPLKQIFRSHSLKHGPLYIPTLKRCDDTSFDASCEVQLLSALGLIHSNGAIVDLMSVNGRGQVVTGLPPYPWQHGTRYWNESRLVRDWRLSNEAVRQLNPGTEGFTAKNVLFKSPLVIDEAGSVEIITSLKPVAFNDVMNSEWYSFVIASHDGNVWTEICSGQVRAGAEHEPCQIKIPRYARQVSSEKWYEALSELGLSYGPQFRGLQNISADPLGGRASASVNLVKQHESH